MRIVLTSVHCWPDVRRGGERYLHELAAALQRAGQVVRVVSTGGRGGPGEVLGVPVRRLPVRRLPRRYPEPWQDVSVEQAFGLQALARIAPRALLGACDVWHATSTSDAAAAAVVGTLPGAPATVFTDHGFPARASREARPDRREHALVVRHIDEYVCVSRAAEAVLRRDFGRPGRVVSPGVELAAHRADLPRHRAPVLLYSGSLTEPRKNLPLLLAAANRLCAAEPSLQVWLLGPGDAADTLAAAPAPVRAAVTRCGAVDDDALRAAYGQAWVTVLPSRAESFGMAVVESLASGTPVVVLNGSGGPEEIVDDEAIGRRCDEDAGSLATACAEVLALAVDPATRRACRERASAYDWDGAVVPRLLEVYRAAAA